MALAARPSRQHATKFAFRIIFPGRGRPLYALLPLMYPSRVHWSLHFQRNNSHRQNSPNLRSLFCDSSAYMCETTVRLLNASPGDEAGLRSVMAFVEGESAYGWLRPEAGVHRLVRNSPYDPTGRRHTSFSQVRIFPEADSGSGEKVGSFLTPTVRAWQYAVSAHS